MRYLLLLVACLLAPPASAETAAEVQSWCQPLATAKLDAQHQITYLHDHETGFCWGAFASIQTMSAFVDPDRGRYLRLCTPATGTRTQLIKIFTKFVDDHPEIGHEDFAIVAWRAIAAAFPCK